MTHNTNNGKYFVGKVNDYKKRDEWFFGHFADNPLLKSDLVEIAWQDISLKKPEPKDRHYHISSVEINIVLSGSVSFQINGENLTCKKGEFWVIWPDTIIEEVSAKKNTQLMIIRAPSINDKKIVEK